MGDMDRSDLQQLSKEQLIDLVLRLQRPHKNSRTSSKPPSTDKKEKRENSRPAGRSRDMSRTTVSLRTIPMSFATTFRAFARRVAALFRPTSIGN